MRVASSFVKVKKRNAPTQARSQARLARVLDAAAELFAEHGYDGTTMEAIATHAGSSIGSVYRFFKNKHEVFSAVAARLMVREEELIAELFQQSASMSGWPEMIDAVIDAYVTLQDEDPAWRGVWLNVQLGGDIAQAGDEASAGIVEQVTGVMAFFAPQLPLSRRRVVAQTLFELVASMLLMSARHQEETRRALLVETKRVVKLYVADAVGDPDALSLL